jgi:hypothetical protein
VVTAIGEGRRGDGNGGEQDGEFLEHVRLLSG